MSKKRSGGRRMAARVLPKRRTMTARKKKTTATSKYIMVEHPNDLSLIANQLRKAESSGTLSEQEKIHSGRLLKRLEFRGF